MFQIADLNISQGRVNSNPARCGGIFKNHFIANLLINRSVIFENRLAFGEVTDESLVYWFFGSQCRTTDCYKTIKLSVLWSDHQPAGRPAGQTHRL